MGFTCFVLGMFLGWIELIGGSLGLPTLVNICLMEISNIPAQKWDKPINWKGFDTTSLLLSGILSTVWQGWGKERTHLARLYEGWTLELELKQVRSHFKNFRLQSSSETLKFFKIVMTIGCLSSVGFWMVWSSLWQAELWCVGSSWTSCSTQLQMGTSSSAYAPLLLGCEYDPFSDTCLTCKNCIHGRCMCFFSIYIYIYFSYCRYTWACWQCLECFKSDPSRAITLPLILLFIFQTFIANIPQIFTTLKHMWNPQIPLMEHPLCWFLYGTTWWTKRSNELQGIRSWQSSLCQSFFHQSFELHWPRKTRRRCGNV